MKSGLSRRSNVSMKACSHRSVCARTLLSTRSRMVDVGSGGSMPPLRAINLLQSTEGARLHGPELDRWRRWGPYLSERQWGTVREDYSEYGTAWDYFPHDHARSRAYRWGEDGIAGICDRHQFICFSLALWNHRDPILKERMFGLNGNEG